MKLRKVIHVHQAVPLEGTLLYKPHVTHVTFVRLLACVDVKVTLDICFPCEQPLANVATKLLWLFLADFLGQTTVFFVDQQHVTLKITFLSKLFMTNIAFKRHFSCVDHQVPL